jgi:DNA invertase Pin-like site-specific DNA recombinase
VSGATTSRPELDRCLASLASGDVLIVARLDRLGRSAGHLATTVEGLVARGVGFRSLHEAIDTTTAAGRLVLGIFASLAAFERDFIRERTAAALQAKKRRGEALGRPRAMTPSQIAAARSMLDAGESPSHVARIFGVDRSTLYRALARSTAFRADGSNVA